MLGSVRPFDSSGGSSSILGHRHLHLGSVTSISSPFLFNQQQQHQQHQPWFSFDEVASKGPSNWNNFQDESSKLLLFQQQHQQRQEPTSVLDLWSPTPSSRGAGSGLSLGGGGSGSEQQRQQQRQQQQQYHGHGGGGSPCSYDDNHSNTSSIVGGGGGKPSNSSGSTAAVGGEANVDQHQQRTTTVAASVSSWMPEARRDRSLDEWLADLQQQHQQRQQQQQQQRLQPQQPQPQLPTQQSQQQQYGVEELESLLLKGRLPSPASQVHPSEPQAFAKWFLSEQQSGLGRNDEFSGLPSWGSCSAGYEQYVPTSQQQQQQQQVEVSSALPPPLRFAAAAPVVSVLPGKPPPQQQQQQQQILRPLLGIEQQVQQVNVQLQQQQSQQAQLFYAPEQQQQEQYGPSNPQLRLMGQSQQQQLMHLLEGKHLTVTHHEQPPHVGDVSWSGGGGAGIKRKASPSALLDTVPKLLVPHQDTLLSNIENDSAGGTWGGELAIMTTHQRRDQDLQHQHQHQVMASLQPALPPPSYGSWKDVNTRNNNNNDISGMAAVPLEGYLHRKLQRVHAGHSPPAAPPPPPPQQQMILHQQETVATCSSSFVGARPAAVVMATPMMNPSSSAVTSGPVVGGNSNLNTSTNTTTSVADEGLGLMDQLVRLSQAIDVGSMQDAQSILARLNQHLFCQQGSKRIQRLAFYFKEALAARLNKYLSRRPSDGHQATTQDEDDDNDEEEDDDMDGSKAKSSSPLEFFHKVKAHTSFCEVSPLLKFAYLTANQAILEATMLPSEQQKTVHIVDFDPSFGSQWASLLKDAASNRGGTATRLRFTMVGPDRARLHFVAESLAEFADGLSLSPRPDMKLVVSAGGAAAAASMTAAALGIEEGEIVAVNFGFSLHRCLAARGGVEAMLAATVALQPRVVTLAENEVDDNSQQRFHRRFIETLQYYAFVLDSLGPEDGPAVIAVERGLLEPDIANAVAAKGRSRSERHERLSQWKRRMVEAGLVASPMSDAARVQAEYLIKTAPSRNFEIVREDESGALLLGWQGKPLVAVSAWSSTSDLHFHHSSSSAENLHPEEQS